MKTYSGQITKLKPNQVWVFGSNFEGRHGKGAALFARDKCGAIYGQAEGIQGQSYGIVTKDLTKKEHPSIMPSYIIKQIDELYEYAKQNPALEFIVPYKGKTENLNAYSPREMAIMFSCSRIPDNFIFEEEFAKLLILE